MKTLLRSLSALFLIEMFGTPFLMAIFPEFNGEHPEIFETYMYVNVTLSLILVAGVAAVSVVLAVLWIGLFVETLIKSPSFRFIVFTSIVGFVISVLAESVPGLFATLILGTVLTIVWSILHE